MARRRSKKSSTGSKGHHNSLAKQHVAADRLKEALDQDPVDYAVLRKFATVLGVPPSLRLRVWSTLLGVQPGARLDPDTYLELAEAPHRESSTVNVDSIRSLHHLDSASSWSSQELESKQAGVRRLLNAVVNQKGGEVSYYQGMHDVASILLLQIGEEAAEPLLASLSTGHLKDATRATLDATLELLQLILPLLATLDPQLAQHIGGMGVPTHFALSWLITWFSHNLGCIDDIARLFDVFIASHPCMPLYVAVTAMHAARDQLLLLDDMPVLYKALSTLDILGHLSCEQLILRAVRLHARCPPVALMDAHRIRTVAASSVDAALSGGVWRVPEDCRPHNAQGGGGRRGGSSVGRLLRAGGASLQLRTVLSVLIPAGASVVALAAVLFIQGPGLLQLVLPDSQSPHG